MYGCVYRIVCLVNGKVYVGATSQTLYRRWHDHLHNAKHNRYPNHPLYSDIRKYGETQFRMIVVRYRLTKNAMLQSERFYINKLDAAYPNGYNFMCGRTPEIVRIRSDRQKEKWRGFTTEHRCARSKNLSKSSKRWWAGLTSAQKHEQSKRISEAQKRRWKSVPVDQKQEWSKRMHERR